VTGLAAGLLAAITIAVAGPASSPEYLPLQVAQAEGYFAQEKVEVTLKIERSGADAARALAHGRADIAATSLDAAYRLGHVEGAPPLLVFGLTAAPPVAILVSPLHKDTLRTPAELRGQIVGLPGVGTPEQAVLETVLARAHVRIHQVPIRSYGTRALEGALVRGEVAAAVMADPSITRMVEDGTASILVDMRRRADAARWLGAETVHAALFVRPASTLGEPELTGLVRALLRGVARVTEATPEALLAVLPASVTVSPEAFRARLEGSRQSFLPGGLVTTEVLTASIEQARDRTPFPAALKLPWFAWSSLLYLLPLRRATETTSPAPR